MNGLVLVAAIGFANLSQLIAAHPMHPVLASYDREIVSLRSTERVAGLAGAARRADAAACSARRAADRSAARAMLFARRDQADRAAESAALSEILGLRGAGARETRAYANDLQRETVASSRAYEDAAAQRAARALAQRRVQLQERESGLAYDLARRDAARAMIARLKLNELHLRPSLRSALRTELTHMHAREAAVLAVARAKDAVELQAYQRELERTRASAVAAMTAQLRDKAMANLNVQRGIFKTPASQGMRFRSTYDSAAAIPIGESFRAAGEVLSARFGRLAETDRQSATATSSQLRTLEADRDALYRSMVAEISTTAASVARRRHLGGVTVADSRPNAAVDITAAVRREIGR